jgi:ATP-dependent RNA helicase RhlE
LTNFSDFGLAGPIMLALADEGHQEPTPIQISAIPPLMAGRDLLGIAQTGTGKTAAFALPILHRLSQSPRATQRGDCRILVITPTRELAAQVHERFCAYGSRLRLRTALVIGGASMARQKAMTRDGLDILVATPGRLLDLVDQGALSLSKVETLVLDEIDQMLDLGFIHAIRAIVRLVPANRQSVFLSATMPPAIARLADTFLRNPVRAQIAAKERLKIDESVVHVEAGAKPAALVTVVRREDFTRGLVFTRTKRGADKVVRHLNAAGATAFAIHGNRSQSQRERALGAFRSGKTRILVATDIAARGLDISDVSHVVNYDLPNVPETYVHRIGRTARAGAAGVAISFCSAEERVQLRSIERLTQQKIAVFGDGRNGVAPGQRPINDNGRLRALPEEARASRDSYKVQPNAAAEAMDAENGSRKVRHGEGRTARIRRRRHRGAPGRQLSRAAG